MMNLHTDTEAFRELIELSSAHFQYEQSHIEKDYWVCKILKELAESEFNDKVYFKGGTSLSKAYHAIERFSEDLDLFVFTGDRNASKQAEKTLNKRLSHFIVENNSGMYREELSETGGNYRKLYFSYDKVYEHVGLKENLEVEIKSCDLVDKSLMYYPFDKCLIKPIITEFLESIGQEQLIKDFGMEGFIIQCVNPRKTICDKISRLTKLSYNDDYPALLAKHIRDIYDLCSLYRQKEFSDFIASSDFMEALLKVTIEDGLNRNSQSHQVLSEAIIFNKPKETITIPEINRAYLIELRKLVFTAKQMPPLEEVIKALEYIQVYLKQFEQFRNS